MSSALLRQALDFVDPDESSDKNKRKKRSGGRPQSASGQEVLKVKLNKKSKNKNLKEKKEGTEQRDDRLTQEAISKLLKLSKPSLDKKIANKIVERAATGKPVRDKINVKTEQQKSILFPDEGFKHFEKTPFCN